MPVEGPDSRKEFYLEIKNPPTSENTTVDNLFRWLFYGKKVEVKRRPRTFAPARFSLTMTLNVRKKKLVGKNNHAIALKNQRREKIHTQTVIQYFTCKGNVNEITECRTDRLGPFCGFN